jgi:hypothetical protein
LHELRAQDDRGETDRVMTRREGFTREFGGFLGLGQDGGHFNMPTSRSRAIHSSDE